MDTVNIMAYDAANITFDHERILQNFVEHGVPKEKVRVSVRVRVRARARVNPKPSPNPYPNPNPNQINMGFEPGEQAAGGEWQGKAVDNDAARRLTLALTLTPILSLAQP